MQVSSCRSVLIQPRHTCRSRQRRLQHFEPQILHPALKSSCSRKQPLRRLDHLHRLMAHASKGHSATSGTNAADVVEGGIAQSLGNFFFRSKYSGWLYNTSVSAPFRLVRLAAMTLIAWILLGRSWRLFARYDQLLSPKRTLSANPTCCARHANHAFCNASALVSLLTSTLHTAGAATQL